MSVTFPKGSPPWISKQKLQPLCVAVDFHDHGIGHFVQEYVFDRKDVVLRVHRGWHDYVTVEDHWNGDVLAQTNGVYGGDHVRCAEELFGTSHGNRFIRKEVVDSVIYKLMTGDIQMFYPGLQDG